MSIIDTTSLFLRVNRAVWRQLFSRPLRLQRFIVILSVLGAFIGFIITYEPVPRPTKDYQQQIDALNETESGIRQLIDFIEVQKGKLSQSQALVSSLKEEESKLRPMVEADRRIVDAILDAQNKRNETHIWTERIISFFLGVSASIVATLFVNTINKAKQVPRPARKTL